MSNFLQADGHLTKEIGPVKNMNCPTPYLPYQLHAYPNYLMHMFQTDRRKMAVKNNMIVGLTLSICLDGHLIIFTHRCFLGARIQLSPVGSLGMLHVVRGYPTSFLNTLLNF